MSKEHISLCAGCGMELQGQPAKISLCPECEKKIQNSQVAWLSCNNQTVKPTNNDRQLSLW